MDEKNTKANKIGKMKIRSNSSSKQSIEELEKLLLDSEIQLSIKCSPQGNHILRVICPLFPSFQNLLSITFKLNNENICIDISPFLLALKDQKNLEKLTMKLQNMWSSKTYKEIGIGECIENLTNLQLLDFDLKNWNPLYYSEFFSLESAYKKLQNLKILKLNFLQIKKPSMLISIFKGIKHQQSLQSLIISLNLCIFDEGLNTICDELIQLTNLRKFEMKDVNYYSRSKNYSNQIYKCIKHLENLENLNLSVPFDSQKNEENGFCLEGIQQLKNLKELTLNVSFSSYTQLKNFTNIISYCQNLENTQLFIQISESISYEQLSSSLKLIKNITKLNIDPFSYRTTQEDIFNFILSLENQKRLISLSFSYDEIFISENQIDSRLIEKCRNILMKLESFTIESCITKQDIQGFVYPSNLQRQLISGMTSLKNINLIQSSDSFYNLKKKILPMNIGELIFNTQDLQKVQLKFDKRCILSQNKFLNFVITLQMNCNLSILHLHFRNIQMLDFNDKILLQLNKTFLKCNKLTELIIIFGKNNNFSSVGVQKLNEGLMHLQELKILQFSFKNILMQNKNIEFLFGSIKYLKCLKSLHFQYTLSSNEISEEKDEGNNGYIQLPSSLEIISIRIKGFNQKYQLFRSLVSGFCNLNRLKQLNLKVDIVEFQQSDLNNIYKSLANLTKLKEISINFKSLLILNLIQLFSKLQLLQRIKLYNKRKIQYSNFALTRKYNKNEIIIENDQIQQQDYIKFQLDSQYKIVELDTTILHDFFQKYDIQSFVLNISRKNEINERISQQLFSSLHLITNLKQLTLHFKDSNDFICDYFLHFGEQLEFLINLNKLKIESDIFQKNENEGYKLQQFADKLMYLTNLVKFQFIVGNTSQKELNMLFDGIKNLPNLRFLQVQSQQVNFDNEGLFIFQEQEFVNLTELRIQNQTNENKLSKEFIKNIKNLKSLRVLKIYTIEQQKYYYLLFKILRLVQIND